MSRPIDKIYDIPNPELDFYFYDSLGSVGKIFNANGIEWPSNTWAVENFISRLDKLVAMHNCIEQWTIKDDIDTTVKYYGLRFKTAKDKLAFMLKYL